MRHSRQIRAIAMALRIAIAASASMTVLGCHRKPTPPRGVDIHFKLTHPDALGSAISVMAMDSFELRPLFSRSPRELHAQAIATPGAPDLSLWFRARVSAQDAGRIARELSNDPRITSAFVAPIPELATSRRAPIPVTKSGETCPIKTPSYEPYQGYLSAAPFGINVPVAWSRPGGRGERVWFADVEGGWNDSHEDLPGRRITHVHGERIRSRDWTAHGTAVLGQVVARDNGVGMVGIAPETERVITASIAGSSPAAAIDGAAAKLRPGDVLLIELHSIGPRGRFLPMEFWDDVYDAIKLATARGVIVIEAAGNGAEDLDHPRYQRKLERGYRDSGAIMVGAGAPARAGFVDRSRLDFSNFGSRVDLQGWGRHVATLDYGDLQNCADPGHRDYTDLFSGTSSASPIVAGAAILVQSISKAERSRVLTPQEMRERLVKTGSPQTDGPHGGAKQQIGPRPDLAQALRW